MRKRTRKDVFVCSFIVISLHLFSFSPPSSHPFPPPPLSPLGEQSILKVQEKFKLDLTDEQATEAFQQLIVDSSRAFAPQVTDTLHRWAQYWRD